MSALEVKNLVIELDNNFKIIDDISFKINKSEIVAIVGPSGCGKSILLHALAGFIKPTKGKILSFSKKNYDINPSKIMIFQDLALFPWKNTIENIEVALKNSNFSHSNIKNKSLKVLKLVGLEKFSDWPIYKLSGGMKQRVAIARALVLNPKIILLDEPLSALDYHNKKMLIGLLKKIWKLKKITVVIVTHNISEATEVANKILVLSSRPAKIIASIENNLNMHAKEKNKIHSTIIKLLKNEVCSSNYNNNLSLSNLLSLERT